MRRRSCSVVVAVEDSRSASSNGCAWFAGILYSGTKSTKKARKNKKGNKAEIYNK